MTRLTNTGHKNITYREDLDDYFVQLFRDRKKFSQAFNTLEEAIDVRDKAIQFYEEFSRLPSSKELGLRRREHRRKDNRLNERYISIEKKNRTRPYQLCVIKHGAYFSKNFATLEEAIEIRAKLLQFFKENDRLPSRKEQEELFGLKFKPRIRKHHRKHTYSRSNTGMLHITFNKSYDRYQIQVVRQQQRFSAISHSLEEAIAIRDNVLKFYDEYSRLPTKSEYHASLKKGTLI